MRGLIAGGCLLACAVLASGSGSPGLARGEPGAPGGVAGTQVRVLQMNLCDSGLAGCYTGRSVTAAAAVIRDQAPDLVTLNEVCRDDVSILERALARSDQVGATACGDMARVPGLRAAVPGGVAAVDRPYVQPLVVADDPHNARGAQGPVGAASGDVEFVGAVDGVELGRGPASHSAWAATTEQQNELATH